MRWLIFIYSYCFGYYSWLIVMHVVLVLAFTWLPVFFIRTEESEKSILFRCLNFGCNWRRIEARVDQICHSWKFIKWYHKCNRNVYMAQLWLIKGNIEQKPQSHCDIFRRRGVEMTNRNCKKYDFTNFLTT